MSVAPRRVHVRMYQVGFGDCFLLSFDYGRQLKRRSVRHVLIDCGTNRTARGTSMKEVATLIAGHCEGKLDAVVVTHRHRDHMSAFGTKETREILAPLAPDVVVRPWTEDPDRPARARSFLGSLDRAQAFAAAVEERIPKDKSSRGLLGGLREFAAAQVKNQAAMAQLKEWVDDGSGEYLHVGDGSAGLERALPGVGIRVLGPPTADQWPAVLKERSESPEYWLRLRRAVGGGRVAFIEDEVERLAEADSVAGPADQEERSAAVERERLPLPGPTRWLLERMLRQQSFVVHRLVRLLDEMLNNTSLILLFQFGTHRMLFSGDAEIANWEYVLGSYGRRAALLRELRQVDLYKVGHHGSRNATPKLGLYGPWEDRPDGALTSIVSTKLNVYPGRNAVPRTGLLTALGRLGPLHSSHRLKQGGAFVELVADARQSGWRRMPVRVT